MRHGRRQALVLAGLGALAVLLVWAASGLPASGTYHAAYGLLLTQVAQPERHTTQVVAAVVFDYRGFDTLGEEFILFTAAAAVALLLREAREEEAEERRDRAPGDALPAVTALLVGPIVLLGLCVVAYGYVTPGGGFQGGVVLAAGLVLVLLGARYDAYRRLSPTALINAAEGGGALVYIAVGVFGLAAGGAYLENVLPLGTSGTLLSSGAIAVLNWGVALEVAGAFVLLSHEFAEDLEAAGT